MTRLAGRSPRQRPTRGRQSSLSKASTPEGADWLERHGHPSGLCRGEAPTKVAQMEGWMVSGGYTLAVDRRGFPSRWALLAAQTKTSYLLWVGGQRAGKARRLWETLSAGADRAHADSQPIRARKRAHSPDADSQTTLDRDSQLKGKVQIGPRLSTSREPENRPEIEPDGMVWTEKGWISVVEQAEGTGTLESGTYSHPYASNRLVTRTSTPPLCSPPDEFALVPLKPRVVPAKHISGEYDNGFLEFWKLYPRHVGKWAAQLEWRNINLTSEMYKRILGAITRQRQNPRWYVEHMHWCPLASTWLHGRRWDDDADHERVPWVDEDDAALMARKDNIEKIRRGESGLYRTKTEPKR